MRIEEKLEGYGICVGIRIEEREETNSVHDRITEKDWIEIGLRLVQPILWDRQSRFGLLF